MEIHPFSTVSLENFDQENVYLFQKIPSHSSSGCPHQGISLGKGPVLERGVEKGREEEGGRSCWRVFRCGTIYLLPVNRPLPCSPSQKGRCLCACVCARALVYAWICVRLRVLGHGEVADDKVPAQDTWRGIVSTHRLPPLKTSPLYGLFEVKSRPQGQAACAD